MKRLIASLITTAVAMSPLLSAQADTIEYKAYSAGTGDVLLLPSTQTTTLHVLNDGAIVRSGSSVTLSSKKVITLPSEISAGMLFDTTGAVLGTDAVLLDGGKVKIKTREGKYVIKYDD